MDEVMQTETDQKNGLFWDELCGTLLAKKLGIVDSSRESLEIFDNYYCDYYPYLEKYLCLDELRGKNVLEVGLGYGTISQKLALAGAHYHGLDIASNPVEMIKHRLVQHKLSGDVRRGSMLECPFQDNYFDYVISIGCFHHTGDIQACINQTHRLLKDGGKAIIMVYNKFSLRQWLRWPKITAKNLIYQVSGRSDCSSIEGRRAAYDASSTMEGAPETEFFSVREVRKLLKIFRQVEVTRENFDEDVHIQLWKLPQYKCAPRSQCLDSRWAKYFGLDLYIQAIK